MPTKLARTYLTHTKSVERALKRAALRWPDASSDSVLLTRIAEDWAEQNELADDHGVAATAGKYQGVFSPGYLDELRSEWDR